MAIAFGARSRFTSPKASAVADLARTIERSVRRVYLVLNGTPQSDAPRPFSAESASPTSACWILHAR